MSHLVNVLNCALIIAVVYGLDSFFPFISTRLALHMKDTVFFRIASTGPRGDIIKRELNVAFHFVILCELQIRRVKRKTMCFSELIALLCDQVFTAFDLLSVITS